MGDSYRPGRSDRDRDHDRDRDRPPPLAHRMTFTHGNGDTYRPGGSQRQQGFSGRQAEFTFQSSRSAPHFPPSGPANTGSHRLPTRRARGGPPQRNSRRDDNLDMPHNRNKNNVNGSRRGGFRKPAPHERALLRQRDDASPEHTMGISDGPNKFLNIDDLSDDEEADMDVESDLSDGEGKEGDDQPGNQKVARTHVLNRADGDSIPKWSNPDPYTVLPPPEETTGKKTDFVKLIRKAKNQAAEKAAGHNAVAANDDFISFGEDDNTEQEESRLHSAIRPNSWQRHSNGLHIVEDDDPSSHERHGDASTEQPVRGSLNDLDSVDSFVHGPYDGKRADDAAKTDSRLHPSVRSNKRKQDFSVGIVEAWASTPRSSSTPWLRSPGDYAHLARNPDKWLHNEILDFYDYVAPKPYEHDVRHSLVQRVNSALGSRRFPHDSGRILCFGSFPAGLYLPTADMDLVYTSDRYYNGGTPVLDFSQKGAHKSLLYKAARRLRDMHMCIGAPTVIAMAKVPIIKFQDSITNLQVDISFENLSGVQAQATFARWKGDHPDVVYMVALLKQFLAMRGLNEVHQGGLGGFSIICLVVSYLQHSRKGDNLGECFLGFLDYYGNQFDLSTKRIQMDPPAVVTKTAFGIDDRPEKPDGLSIQDPNRPSNNISGGSHRAKDAFKAFALAHRFLQDRMLATKNGQNIGASLLECILGGNYESYRMQRAHLESLR